MANPTSTTIVKTYEYPTKKYGMFQVITHNDVVVFIEYKRDGQDENGNPTEKHKFSSNDIDFAKGVFLALKQMFNELNIDPKL